MPDSPPELIRWETLTKKQFDRIDRDAVAKATIPDTDAVAPWMTASDTAWGRLHHLGPVLQLSSTPGHWERPVAPLGSHPASWPAR